MKYISLLITLFFISDLVAQDTLIFNNGDTVITHFVSVDKKRGLIIYTDNSDTIISSMNKLYDSGRHVEAYDTLVASESMKNVRSEPPHIQKYSFFKYPVKYQYGKFALTTNLTSLLKKRVFSNDFRFEKNRVLTIEPELYISEKMSVKIPVSIGINRIKPPSLVYDYISWNTYNESDSRNILPRINEYYFEERYYEYVYLHPPNLIWQFGIYTKHFNPMHTNNYFYFSQGLNLGVDNRYAIDFYHLQVYTGESWATTSTRFDFRDNPSYYLKYEVIGGLNISRWRLVNLSAEAGCSIRMGGNGKVKDQVFRSIDEADYVLIYTHLYTIKKIKAFYFVRLNLILRTQGKKAKTNEQIVL